MSNKKLNKTELVNKVMADKKAKTPNPVKPVTQPQVDELDLEMELIDIEPEETIEMTEAEIEPTATPSSPEPKQDKPEPSANTQHLEAIMKKLPAVVTTKDLCQALGFDDGGKTLRRTLRAKFANAHDHKAKWEWKNGDPLLTAILNHFVGKTSTPKAAKAQ